jgi:hypothetical protein
MIATIKSNGTARCYFCCQEKEGVDAEFRDNLKGFFCWNHFREALKARAERPAEKKEQAKESRANVDSPKIHS